MLTGHIFEHYFSLFYRYFRPLIDEGYIYIAQPPLYKIQKGKDVRYAYTEDEKFSVLKDMGVEVESEADSSEEEGDDETEETAKKTTGKARIQRYKGLGEMNAEELWETTMNRENRILKRVDVDDAQMADKTFDVLMGTDVSSRKSLFKIMLKWQNLDI